MKCPKCEELGLKSKVFSKGSSSTLMGYPSYHDEEGVYHHHDRNKVNTVYICSEGHTFYTTQKGTPCPSYPENCDFGGGPIEIKIIE